MRSDCRSLYQEIILDHNQNPRHHHEMPAPSCEACGFNPLCGDKMKVYLSIEDDVILAASFLGQGCAISQASASLMMESLQGLSVVEANTLFQKVHAMILGSDEAAPQGLPLKLDVLSGVKAYPARVKCATLAWHTLEAALQKNAAVVSTE